MVKQIVAHEDVNIPKGVSVKIAGRTVTVKGPRGALTKSFNHLDIILKLVNKNKTVRAEVWFGTKAIKACCRTVTSHINNMMIGVTKGFLYKMKLVHNHFPMDLQEEGRTLVIRNFLGEKYDRRVALREGVELGKSDTKGEIVLTGNDIDAVSQVCADLHTSTLVRDKDIRKFLDGVYVSYRGNVIED